MTGQAGFTILRATGSAFVVEAEGKSFYMSAIAVSRQDHPGVESLQEAVQNGTYQLYAEIDGISIYTDGIRYVWITQALQVHVQGGPPTDPLPSDAVLGTLVRLTQAIPYSETTPETTSAGQSWRGLWPQDSRDEAERAQRLADQGEPWYAWQLNIDGEDVFLRYAREVLGWRQPQPLSILVPEGEPWAREVQVLRCAPGPNPDYPEIDCAPSRDRTYPAVHITVERLVRPGPGGIWIVTQVERTEVSLPAPPPLEEVRRLVTEFLERRVEGSGAEGYLSDEARSRFGERARLGPLYGPARGLGYDGYEIAFIDGPSWAFADSEVGVRMFPTSRREIDEETLFVGPRTSPPGEGGGVLILGGRPGLMGP